MANLTLPISDMRDHILGDGDAPATLVEYGDYECPHCRTAHGIVGSIRAKLGATDLRFVYRNFPLATIHPHAQMAAIAAETVGAQGDELFWKMHHQIYTNQHHLEPEDLRRYVEAIGADVARFESDLDNDAFAARVSEDFSSGVRSGVNGTPSFFINGVRHDDSWDEETLLAALRKETVGA